MNQQSSFFERIKERPFAEWAGGAITLLLLFVVAFYFANFLFFPTTEESAPLSMTTSEPVDPILAACPPHAHASAFREDQVPDLANLGINLCYELLLNLNDAGNAFDAVAKVTIRNGYSTPWPHLLFRLYAHSPIIFGGDIKIEETLVDGVKVEGKRILPDRTGLYVPLSKPLNAGESVQVSIRFSGRLTEFGKQERAYGLFTYSPSTVTLASWFPMLAVWDDDKRVWHENLAQDVGDTVFAESAFMQAKITSPERFSLAATGVIWDEQSSDGRTTYVIAAGPVRDLTLVWLDGYQVVSTENENQNENGGNGPIVRSWYQPNSEAAGIAALKTAQDALTVFSDSFGPYPFKELEIVQVPLWNWGGMEYPQLALLAEHYYRPNSDTQPELASLVAHEIAHQWWYSNVGSDVHATPWQDEALAEWSALLWMEKIHGNEAYQNRQAQLGYMWESLQAAEGNPPLSQSTEQLRGNQDIYYALIYGKGALFLDELRKEIGDDAFFAALRDYHTNNRFKIAPPIHLLTAFEARSQRPLDDFYTKWGVEKESQQISEVSGQ
ncbi:MAG: M1 family metallopeptidase [Ardenticatenaceae bacterium]